MTRAKKTVDPAELPDMPYADATVHDRTGHGWVEWIEILDKIDGSKMTHAEMVKHLTASYPEVSGWWVQGIVVGYERARGLRVKNQNLGGFSASISKTLPMAIDHLYQQFADAKLRAKWFGRGAFEISKTTPPKSIRASLADGSKLEILFYPKGDSKSSVSIEHSKLPDADAVKKSKAVWKERLEKITS